MVNRGDVYALQWPPPDGRRASVSAYIATMALGVWLYGPGAMADGSGPSNASLEARKSPSLLSMLSEPLQPRWLDDGDGFIWRGQEPDEERPMETDRPDFTEASSTVPRGRIQMESGYTFTYDHTISGELRRVHTAPEVLFRYGYSDDIELRLAWTYIWESVRSAGVTQVTDGAEDMSVGVKLALSEQSRLWPELAVILSLGIPTGAKPFSHQHVESGVNLLYGWDVAPRWTLAGSTGFDTASELVTLSLPLGTFAFRDQGVVFHQSITTGFAITERWGSYFEYFALHIDSDTQERSDHFLDGGFTFLLDPNTQYDIRVGIGLNEQAEDFFAGVGYSVRR